MPGIQYLTAILGESVAGVNTSVPIPLSDKIEILDDQKRLSADTVYLSQSDAAAEFLRTAPAVEAGTLLITSETRGQIDRGLLSGLSLNLIETTMTAAGLFNFISRAFRKIEGWRTDFERLSRPDTTVEDILKYTAEESGASVYLIEDERFTSVSGDDERVSDWVRESFFAGDTINTAKIAEFTQLSTPIGSFRKFEAPKAGELVYFRQLHSRSGLTHYYVICGETQSFDYAFLKLSADALTGKLGRGADPALLDVSYRFGKLWQNILDKKYIGKTEIYDQLNKFDNPALLFVRVLLICFEDHGPDDKEAGNVLLQLNELFPGCTITLNSDEAVILMYHSERILNLRLDEPAINAFLTRLDGYMAVGANTRDYSMLRTHYLLAKRTVSLAKKLGVEREGRIYQQTRYNEYCIIDFCVERFVEEFGHDDIINLIHPAVVQLLRYDKKYNNNLEDILHSYLLNDCNVTRTAEETFMHRNTVINKMNRIMSLIDADLTSPKVRQQLLFSQQVLRYYEKVLNLKVV